MQIIVPLAGPSTYFPPETYTFPKPLVEIGGVPMIERVVENLRGVAHEAEFIFLIPREDAARFSLDRTVQLLAGPRCRVVTLRAPTRGALCSALLAIDLLDPERPLVIANGDQVIDADLAGLTSDMLAAGAEAGCITFESVHPRWSYVRREGDLVLQAAEKRVISRDAIAGFYLFRSAATFIRAAMRTIAAGAHHDGSYYIAPALNELVLEGVPVLCRKLQPGQYRSFYSPAKIHEFEGERLMQASQRQREPSLADVQVVIPAAGEGSRFRQAGFRKPKPFIDVLGRPMLDHVIGNVTPRGAKVHLLLREEHLRDEAAEAARLAAAGHKLHHVDRLTEGTACTLLLARAAIDNDQPLLVANSDQLVDFSIEAFVQDCLDRGLDGSILVFRDAAKDPKWSFARIDTTGLVQEVAEKKPISDLATVGIYLFRRGSEFVSAAIDMIARNDRVNNEFYTCPVYNYMIRSGSRIGVYEIPPEAMNGLGTPSDLTAFLAARGAAE